MLIQSLIVALLSITPISEARGAIIYGLASGLNPYLVFISAVFLNILIIPIIFFMLKKANIRKFAFKVAGKKVENTIHKYHRKFELYQEFALVLFVAIPLPITGAWTGTLIADVLEMNHKKAWLAISIGILISAIIVTASVNGSLFLLGKLF